MKLIWVFVFTYADCWFSHEAAHILQTVTAQLECIFALASVKIRFPQDNAHSYMSHRVRKLLTRSDTDRSVLSQKNARNLNLNWIYVEEELHYPCTENKDADQHHSYCEAICTFVFAYTDCWFSHAAAHILHK